MKSMTLQTKTFILIISAVLVTALPLILGYLWAARGLGSLGTDPKIESSLSRCIDLSADRAGKGLAAAALRNYGQIKVLKDRIVKQVAIFSFLYTAAMILLLLAAGYRLTARVTRPLKELTAATRRIAEDRLDTRLQEKDGGEIGELVRAFNTMADDLAVAREQRAIAERRATWQHVARTIAHEIKNPLTPIKLSTERLYEKYLMESKDFPEVIRSTTTTVLTEIANLQKLVDTFHRYAKFPDPVLEEERLADVAEEAAGLFTGAPAAIERSFDGGLPPLKVDKGQIREAVTNLLKNAFEAVEGTGRAPKVRLAVRRRGNDAVVSVKDNGCGISAENRKRLFQPYFTTKKQGSGIGLALIERIVTLHGGKIVVESEENIGTEISLVFPISLKENKE